MRNMRLFLFSLLMTISVSATFAVKGSIMTQAIQDNSKSGIVLATWNIGHYSNGKQSSSLIDPKQYKEKLKGFKRIVYDSLSADLIGINEYSSVITKNKHSKEYLSTKVLFNKYNYKNEGDKSWICNSIFSNFNIFNVERFFYESSKPYISKVKKAALFNYVSADIFIDGEKVKIVYVHLISKEPQIRKLQAQELIEKYKKYRRIVIFGDFNTSNLKPFKDDGYIIANDGSLITFPSKSIAIDNVLVKGLTISDVRVFKTDLSDHYPLVCRIQIQ